MKKRFQADDHHVELAANIGTPEDVKGVLENGGEGVGLYRTECLYMGREDLPTEEGAVLLLIKQFLNVWKANQWLFVLLILVETKSFLI